ncbi:hypothetical protein JOY44_30560 (plasmid) [Phormidium sp. CLA17]|nr:hypothetical protein [Leptolyngbya sp. Cla-17]MBM0745757.1 hypothetical protein [Leptolyngbya sp. Cla-17]
MMRPILPAQGIAVPLYVGSRSTYQCRHAIDNVLSFVFKPVVTGTADRGK